MIAFVINSLLLRIVGAYYWCSNEFSFLSGTTGNIFLDQGVREVQNYLPAGTGTIDVVSDFSKYIDSNGNTWDRNDLFLYRINDYGSLYQYTGSNNWVQIEQNTGRVFAYTTGQYSRDVYIRYCCEYYGNFYSSSDCRTHDQPLTVSCCDCASVTISAPTGFQKSYTVLITSGTVSFNFADFSTNLQACSIQTYKIYDQNSDVELSEWQVTDLGNGYRAVDVPSSLQSTEAVYNFMLRVETDGTGTGVHFESLTVTVTCTGATNTMQFGTTHQSPLTNSQFVSIGTATNFYVLPRYSSSYQGAFRSNPACADPITYELISSDGGSDNTYSNLAAPTLNSDSSHYIVVPNNPDMDDLTYSFKWQATDSMDSPNVLVHSSVFYLIVGCPRGAESFISQSMTSQSYTLDIGTSGTPFTSGKPIQFQSLDLNSYTTCRVVSQYNLITVSNYIDTASSGISQPTISQYSTQFACTQSDCGHLSVSTTDHLYSLDIQIQFKITGNDESASPIMTFDSPTISLTVQCPADSQLQSSITKFQIAMQQNDASNSTLSFNHFTCSNVVCCTFQAATSYVIQYQGGSDINPITCCQAVTSGATETGFSYSIDVTQYGTAIYKVQASSSQGEQLSTSNIELIVYPDCSSSQTLSSGITTFQIYMQQGHTGNTTIDYNHFTCGTPPCCTFAATSSYTIQYQSGDLSAPITCCQPSTDVTGTEIGFSYSVDVSNYGSKVFQIVGTSSQGDTLITSNIEVIVVADCSSTQLQSTISTFQIYMQEGYTANNTQSFNHFYCSSSPCCTFSATTSYTVSYQSGDLSNPINCCQQVTDGTGRETGFQYIIDVSQYGSKTYVIQATSSQGDQLSTASIELIIVPDCSTTILQSDMSIFQYYMQENYASNTTLSFNHFTCAKQPCCILSATSNYIVEYQSHTILQPITCCQPVQDAQGTETGVSYSVDVTQYGTALFTILATSHINDQLRTSIIEIIILPDCSTNTLSSSISQLLIYMQVGTTSNSSVSLNHYSCSIPPCCTFSSATSYQIEYQNVDSFEPISCCQAVTNSIGTETGFSYTVDVSRQGTTIFQINGTSAENQTLNSQNIEVIILPAPVLNDPPYFKITPSCPVIQIDFSIQANDSLYECQLGQVIDDNQGDIITISVSFTQPNIMSFQESSMTIFVKQSDIQRSDIGMQTANFILQDDKGGQTITSVPIIISDSESADEQNLEVMQNKPPAFEITPNCPVIEIDFEIPQIYPLYRCDLGKVIDPNKGDTVTISAQVQMEKTMYFDGSQMAIFIDMNLLQPSDIGINSVYFTLTDDKDGETKTNVAIMIKQPDIKENKSILNTKVVEENAEIVKNQFEDSTKNLSAKISSISNIGLLTVKFNQSMLTKTLNLTDINSTILDIHIEPSIIYFDYQNNQSNYNLTWNVTNFDVNVLQVQLYLDYPLKISPGAIQDILHFKLKKPENVNVFTSAETGKNLHFKWWHLQYGIGKQMESNDFNQQFEQKAKQINEYMIYLLVFSILLYVLTQGGLAMQFMFILVYFPANAMLIIREMIPTVGFDILEATIDWETQPLLLFDFEQHDSIKERIYNQLVDLGYDSYNSLMLLQTLGLLLLIYFFQVILWGFFSIFVLLSRNKFGGKEYCKSKSKELFFGPLIELFIQGYFEFFMAGILTYMLEKHILSGEVFSNILGIFSLIVTLVLLPIALIVIVFIKSELIRDESFQNRWGKLYSNLNYIKRSDDRFARAYFLIFVLRRMTFVGVAFQLVDVQIYQILILVIMQIIMHLYQGINRPGPCRISNRFDLFNEFQVLICTQTIIMFTKFTDSVETQFMCGWGWVAYLTLTILINLSYIFYHSLRSIKLIITKYYRRIKYKLTGNSNQENVSPLIKKNHEKNIQQIVKKQNQQESKLDIKIKAKGESNNKKQNEIINASEQLIQNQIEKIENQQVKKKVTESKQGNRLVKEVNLKQQKLNSYKNQKLDSQQMNPQNQSKKEKSAERKTIGNQSEKPNQQSSDVIPELQINSYAGQYMSQINVNTIKRINHQMQLQKQRQMARQEREKQEKARKDSDLRFKQINDKIFKQLRKKEKDKKNSLLKMQKISMIIEEQYEETNMENK